MVAIEERRLKLLPVNVRPVPPVWDAVNVRPMNASKLVWSLSVAAVNGVSGRNRVFSDVITHSLDASPQRAEKTTAEAARAAARVPVTTEKPYCPRASTGRDDTRWARCVVPSTSATVPPLPRICTLTEHPRS